MKKDELFSIAESILRLSDSPTDVVIFYNNYVFQRFANSFIHQPTYEENINIGIRIREGSRVSVVWTNSVEKEKLANIIKKAKELLREEEFVFEMSKKEIPISEFTYDEFEIDFEKSASIIKEIISIGRNYKAFGNFFSGFQHTLLLSSDGFEGYNKASMNNLTINYINKSSAWSQYSSYKFSDILENYENTAKDCLNKAILNENLSEIEPGKYTVILSSLAISDILSLIDHYALSSKSYYEGTSPFAGKLNQKVFSDKLNLYEEPLNRNLFAITFDFEGNIRENFPVIENGVLKNIALNNKYSKLLNLRNNACANIPFFDYPIFSHLHLKGGNKSLNDILEETERGILVSRIWYANLVEPMSLTITGMTRDGLFLIENGKIKCGLKNMRFTQSFISALNNIEAISKDEKLIVGSNFYEFFPGGFILPDIKFSEFQFISKTEF